jgi:DNA-3-methyladenine glycosylase I
MPANDSGSSAPETPAPCWGPVSPLMADYHDNEWGIAVRDDRALFEKLMLDAFQAGLSWEIVLRKRDAFAEAFGG